MPKRASNADHFATVKELSLFTGIGQQGLRKCYLPLLPADAIQDGRPKRYRCRDIIDQMVERRAATRQSADPMEGEVPDNLELWRGYRAKMAKLELEQKEGTLVEVAAIRDILARWASLIRRMGETLGKRFGNDAAETVNETLDECRRVVDEL